MLGKMVRIGMVAEQLGEPCLGQLEEALVMPERVVGIESDGGEFAQRQLRPGAWLMAVILILNDSRKLAVPVASCARRDAVQFSRWAGFTDRGRMECFCALPQLH
jgi:hypothetical protein